jgi:polyhydroxybutyrate depolymerase
MGTWGRSSARAATALAMVVFTVVVPMTLHAEAAPAQAACSLTPTGSPGISRSVGGRSYLLYVPAGISGPSARLVVALHGWNEGAAAHRDRSGLNAAADLYKFIVAYPTGSGFPVGWDYLDQANADITFLRSLVGHVAGTYCVNPDWVHAEGLSMGGLMSQRLACEASDLYASVAGHATNDVERAWFDIFPSAPCSLPRPTSVYLSCGEADAVTDNGCAPARDAWAARLTCPAPTPLTVPYGIAQRYSPCAAATTLSWRTWTALGHDYPPAGPQRARWHEEMLQFFTANPMP